MTSGIFPEELLVGFCGRTRSTKNELWRIPFVLFLVAGALSAVKGNRIGMDRPCIARDFGRGSIVCVCNSTYCDALPRTPPPPTTSAHQHLIHIFTSSKAGERLHKSSSRFSSRRQGHEGQGGREEDERRNNIPSRVRTESEEKPFLIQNTLEDNTLNFQFLEGLSPKNRISKFWVNRNVKYQTVMGFGGAFTDAAGLNIRTLSPNTQENLIKSYFGPDGAEYTMGRVPIGGTDFSTRAYTYDDRGEEPDTNLTHFALQPEDHELKIPYIKRAFELSEGKLELVASPWSAPVWMKTNDKLNGAGSLKKEFYQTWADYIVRFLDEYKKEGIRIWGVTTGNEPFNGFVPFFPFNCMGWRASDMRDWIADNLGPTLKRHRSHSDVRIIMFDDNKGGLPTWTKQILENNRSAQYVDGIGTHWYFDFITGSDVLSRVHKKHPNHFIIQTESCLDSREIWRVPLGFCRGNPRELLLWQSCLKECGRAQVSQGKDEMMRDLKEILSAESHVDGTDPLKVSKASR
ncbi:unnamed protein product [Allacma fusca]|uniref:Glucosylceramidase n=1 Tax=Allacma fusca TaxID=39272 RepID=A0A8J2P7J0_9HEXA|nr:unnamed protein product [Allacma fusca]